ncbi:hypothetical protein TRFO_10120 [Tritrichomonas foetus]|uniref:Uncharacterized protein n=1 Tax=Tritrichomonas foetus TaxID=1144522 RepID=A0A1J4JAJ5_9EUKA|nr:hypothetical protein TRFO_10120 [Tritrichomonas foetus]|eukprot:OHS96190.1 hypothetical protein TRFO_10120 [Tritrichomonas foetus]
MNSDFPKPSPYVYGCQYCENIIRRGIKSANSQNLADQLIAIINSIDLSILDFSLRKLFTLIESGTNSKQQQTIRQCIKIIVNRFQDQTQFKSIIVKYFDQLPEFPEKLINNLHNETGFTLTVYAGFSDHSIEAIEFLKTKMIPKIAADSKFFISNELLFQFSSLNIPDIDLKKLNQDSIFSRSVPLTLSHYMKNYIPNKSLPVLESTNVHVPLYQVIMELNAQQLTSATFVNQLFDFYSDFNEKHAAVFVLSVVNPESEVKDYLDKLDSHQRLHVFTIYKDIFVTRKINFTKMVAALDVVDFPPLPFESCQLLFSCLCCFFDKQLIPSSSFTRRWHNKKLQFSLLSAMSSIKISNLDFSKGGPLIKLIQLEIPSNAFNQYNNCWVSLEFTERIISLMATSKPALEQYLDTLLNKYPALLLALLGQTNVRITEEIIEVIIPALINVLQGSSSILSVLWKMSSQFMHKIIDELYQRQPGRIELIYESAGKQLKNLLEHYDVGLATDLAFFTSSQNKIEIGDFITKYTQKYTISSLVKIMDFIKNRMTESLPSTPPFQTSVLNSMFSYLSNNFESYPIEIRAFIHRTFSACETMRPEISHFVFDLKIPTEKLHEIKQTASMNYSKLLDDEITVCELNELIEEYRTTDPTLFSCHIHYLLAEFELMAKHPLSDVEKLAQLCGSMIISGSLSSKQIERIFSFVQKGLNMPGNSPEFYFATVLLNHSLQKLSDYPQLVFDVLHDSQLRTQKPSLYDKILKIAQALNEPIQASRAAILNMHPKLRRFDLISNPPPRVCKAVQQIKSEPGSLHSLLNNFPQYKDWIAKYIVSAIQDTPSLLQDLLQPIIESGSFMNIIFQASAAQAHQHILSPEFDIHEGGFVRRRLSILGHLIGSITLAINRPIIGRYLNLKQILLYAFSQGKLYGVVPFVCNIFMDCSKIFMLPNPFTSSILQILAAIYSTDSIKLFIKNVIDELFNKMNVTLGRFATPLPSLFPEKTQNNFDFLMTPFSLQHAVTAPDVERIINFDETSFSQLVSQYIVIPDSPILQTQPELKDKMKRILMQQSLHLIRSEGTLLSRVAASTAQTLVMKDFMLYSDVDLLMECAQTLTKQLAAGLTLFTIPVKVSRQINVALRHENDCKDYEWIESIAQHNYEWIVQLLGDVVRLRAWKTVQKAVENSDAERLQMQKKSKTLSTYNLSTKQAYYSQMQQVYNDISELSINLQPFPILEQQQAKEKMMKTDPEFDAFLSRFQKNGPYGTIYEVDEVTATIPCPDLSGKTVSIESFHCILKSLLKTAVKSSGTPFEVIITSIIERVAQSVPKSLITKAQPYILSWIRNTLRNPIIIHELIKTGLATIQQVDIILTEMLNSEPFNLRNAAFVTNLLHYLIIGSNNNTSNHNNINNIISNSQNGQNGVSNNGSPNNNQNQNNNENSNGNNDGNNEMNDGANHSSISPAKVISSLSCLAACKLKMQLDNQPNQTISKQYEALSQIFSTLEAPSHQLSSATKLQIESTFDPIEEMKNINEIRESFSKWSILLSMDPPNETDIINSTKECTKHKKNFFMFLFFNENERTTLQFLQCMKHTELLFENWSILLDSIVEIIQGNAHVVGYDMRRYYSIFRELLDSAVKDKEMLQQFVTSLHKTRPLLMPTFTFSWIELATDKLLAYSLLALQPNWAAYSILLIDYAALVAQVDITSDIFNNVYRSFLRFLLILIHDFRDFIYSTSPLLLSVLPPNFHQIRNIILSATPSTDAHNLVVKDLDIANGLSASFTKHLKRINIGKRDDILLQKVINAMEMKQDSQQMYIRSFVNTVTSSMPTMKQSDAVEETNDYKVILDTLNMSSPELSMLIINAIVDKLRYDCRETNSYIRLLITLFKTKGINPGLQELIVRVVFERASTPPPHPFGLCAIVKEFVSDSDRTNSIWNLPISLPNESVSAFLTGMKSLFLAKK